MQLQYATLLSGLGVLFTSIHVHFLQTGRYLPEDHPDCEWEEDEFTEDTTYKKPPLSAQRTKHDPSQDFDIYKEPLSPTFYTQCSQTKAGSGQRFIFNRKNYTGHLPITDERVLEKIILEGNTVQNLLSERTVRITDEDFFRRVAQEVVTSHLFDVDDEKELPNSLDYFVLRPNIVNNYVPKFLIGHDYPMCGEVGGGGGGSGEKGGAEDTYPFILMFVFSQISHIHTREVIRQTWGQPSSNWVRNPKVKGRPVRLMFIVGYENDVSSARLARESDLHHDIIQPDVLDTYANLSLKTVSALYWARNYCPGVPHVMKVDSDTFVNVPELVNLLTILPNRAASADGHRWMLGAFHRNPVVHRSGKWEVDPAVYPMERFPSALFGHSYVISGCVIEDLLRAYHRLPFVPIEDAFFTGILAKAMGIRRIVSPWFADNKNLLFDNNVWQLNLHMAVSVTHFDRWQRHLEYYATFISTHIYHLKN